MNRKDCAFLLPSCFLVTPEVKVHSESTLLLTKARLSFPLEDRGILAIIRGIIVVVIIIVLLLLIIIIYFKQDLM